MKLITGLPAAQGVASGPTFLVSCNKILVERKEISEVPFELARLEPAIEKAQTYLTSLVQKARITVGEKEAAIFEAQIAILRDPELLSLIKTKISQEKISLEYAWQSSVQYYADSLRGLNDEYLAARATDVEDVGQCVLRILLNQQNISTRPETPSIILADELNPTDTLLLGTQNVLAFCTRKGGPTSHVVIISRALGIPCIVGLGSQLDQVSGGTLLIVDGGTGKLWIDPDLETIRHYETLVQDQMKLRETALSAAHLHAVTTDGYRIEVVANIGSLDDARDAVHYGAEGIGLLRTEFLFLDRDTSPDLAEQTEFYTSIFKVLGPGCPIVVRTLDIGGDKPARYIKMSDDKNPFLGLRGIRLSLQHQELFETQLMAVLMAGVGYDLRIMFPMVSSLDELDQIQVILGLCRQSLRKRGVLFNDKYQVGIMVEVPSAAILANAFAARVDFFSIGTNDLSQYTLAASRTNADVAHLADPWQPAVIELIHRVVVSAHEHGKWVGLCGEFAGDSLAAPLLLGLGLDELSVSPRLLPEIKQVIRKLSLKECQTLATKSLSFTTANDVRDFIKNQLDIAH
jgi:phosphoenolpyruvate-protein phosphotransferase (PTS system enzyme I)